VQVNATAQEPVLLQLLVEPNQSSVVFHLSVISQNVMYSVLGESYRG